MISKTIFLNQRHWIKATLVFSPIIFLTACTTSGNAIPQGGPTMAQVYEEAMQHSNGEALQAMRQNIKPLAGAAYNGATNLSPYTRTADNEINNLFPVLPNPPLVMYVYPHLAGIDEAPIPGYATAFPLYNQLHYALPGEI